MDNVLIVVDDLEAVKAFFIVLGMELEGRPHGAEPVGEVTQYEDMYRLCYVRGPEGIMIALAQKL